jgi:SAM-dependent methyltransferase
MTLPKLYTDLAAWWPLLSPASEYTEEAAFYAQQLLAFGDAPARTLLELGSGGGNNAFHLKATFQLTLVDIAPGMLAWSRALNPECEHFEGDMRSVRLAREFDRLFIHDAIAYMTSEGDLRRAIATAFVHCRPGGAAVFAPDHLRDNFEPSTDHGGHDGPERGLRYLEWTTDPDPSDSTYTVDYAYLLREVDGSVSVEHDRHVEGLFSRATWLQILTEVGFSPHVLPLEHSDVEPGSCEVFIGVKPRS